MAKSDSFCNRAEAYEAHDDVPLSPARGDTIGDVIFRRYSRRDIMRGTLGAAASAALFGPSLLASSTARAELWISTDQAKPGPRAAPTGSTRWKPKASGGGRRSFSSVAPSAPNCAAPASRRTSETLFVAVQHPAADGTDRYKGFERASTFADPATRWPDFDPDMPPRPSVLVITKDGGGRIA